MIACCELLGKTQKGQEKSSTALLQISFPNLLAQKNVRYLTYISHLWPKQREKILKFVKCPCLVAETIFTRHRGVKLYWLSNFLLSKSIFF